MENTIRWRQTQNELGEEIKESNARIVRWSDGRCVASGGRPCPALRPSTLVLCNILTSYSSMSLYLGSEIFDIYRQALQGEHSHLFVRQGRSRHLTLVRLEHHKTTKLFVDENCTYCIAGTFRKVLFL